MTPSNGVVERDDMALAAMVTGQQQAMLRGKKILPGARRALDRTALHLTPVIQAPSQKQTPAQLSRTKCLKKRLQRLLMIPTCPSLWTTLGRTSPLLMSLQTLRVENCTWIFCRIPSKTKVHGLAMPREGAIENLFPPEAPEAPEVPESPEVPEAPKPVARTMRGRSTTETPSQFQMCRSRPEPYQ